MVSKSLGFAVLALGCLTAAAGGAYVATRHNAADTFVATPPAATAPAPAAPATAQPTQPVAETEALVGTPKPAAAAPATAAKPVPSAPEHETPAAPAKRAERPKPVPQPRAVPTPSDRPTTTRDAVPPLEPAAAGNVPPTTPVEQPRVPDPPPPPPRTPQFEEVVVPASAVIGLQVETAVSSERARVEDRVDARVTRDVLADGHVAIPAGARVIGSVTMVDRGGKVKEPARLGVRFHTLVLADGSEVPLRTEAITREGESPAGDSAKKIGGAAIGGAILGGILGGGKGAVVGGMAGAGGGTAAVMAGDRRAATIASGSIVNARLTDPVTLQVEKRNPEH